MAIDRSIDASAAILVPDPRITYSAFLPVASTYTGTAPIPGQPDPSDEYSVSLTARGDQAAADELVVNVRQGGQIGREGATFTWRLNNGDRHGVDAPTVITDFEAVTWETTPNVANAHVVVTGADELLCVWERGTYGDSVYTSTRASNGTWSAEAEISLGATVQTGCSPCLLRLDDDRLLLFAWIANGTDEGQIRMMFSDDDGTTWEMGASAVLPAILDTSGTSSGFVPLRLRAAQIDGQILLLVSLRSLDTTPPDANAAPREPWERRRTQRDAHGLPLGRTRPLRPRLPPGAEGSLHAPFATSTKEGSPFHPATGSPIPAPDAPEPPPAWQGRAGSPPPSCPPSLPGKTRSLPGASALWNRG